MSPQARRRLRRTMTDAELRDLARELSHLLDKSEDEVREAVFAILSYDD